VLLSTPLHASSNFTVSVQLANKRGFTKTKFAVARHQLHNNKAIQLTKYKPQLSEVRGYRLDNRVSIPSRRRALTPLRSLKNNSDLRNDEETAT
jgi:hypothetical protein